MKRVYFFILVFLLGACSSNSNKASGVEESSIKKKITSKKIIKPELQAILDKANLNGAILVFDASQETCFSNNFNLCEKGNLPASTFKIANSIIAIETGVVEDDSFIFPWNGEDRAFSSWEQDLSFRQAFHYSCVPCYQEVARKIGAVRMSSYLNKFNYGNIEVDSSTIDDFWLVGNSRITPFQQIDFLQRFYDSELPIKKRTETMMKNLIVVEESDNYKLSGKTGWSTQGKNNGWFVGYVETNDQTFYFATNIEPKESFDMSLFPAIRKKITMTALKELGVIKD